MLANFRIAKVLARCIVKSDASGEFLYSSEVSHRLSSEQGEGGQKAKRQGSHAEILSNGTRPEPEDPRD
jgi:hypothetical protein